MACPILWPRKPPQAGTWPDFNRMVGGYFKYPWLDPQRITVMQYALGDLPADDTPR